MKKKIMITLELDSERAKVSHTTFRVDGKFIERACEIGKSDSVNETLEKIGKMLSEQFDHED